jgi:cytochrome c oxidase subunit 2
VPSLNRKIDMIPGRLNRVLLYANKPGRYRGQCAEYCGPQHAHMALYVFAQEPAEFQKWLAQQEATATPPTTAEAKQGQQVFLSNACANCHQIRGTSAAGRVGPDLTHLASRTTLAGLTIANRPKELLEWIRDPQHIKPGNRMPGLNLSSTDRQAIVTYLDGLH